LIGRVERELGNAVLVRGHASGPVRGVGEVLANARLGAVAGLIRGADFLFAAQSILVIGAVLTVRLFTGSAPPESGFRRSGWHGSEHLSLFDAIRFKGFMLGAIPLGVFLDHGGAKDAQIAHADLVALEELAGPVGQARLGARIVMATPLPEELLDLRNVRA